jgi:hypothetical protein
MFKTRGDPADMAGQIHHAEMDQGSAGFVGGLALMVSLRDLCRACALTFRRNDVTAAGNRSRSQRKPNTSPLRQPPQA